MKSTIENDIVTKSSKALDAIITHETQKGQTIAEMARDSLISRGYFDELRAGKKRLNIVHIVKIAKILKKYPSEVLPIEWQKPTLQEINPSILAEAVQEILEKSRDKETAESLLPFEQQCQIMAKLYNKKIRERGKANTPGKEADNSN